MREDLLQYYERELTVLRQLGGEFAKAYPKIANRLLLEPDQCEDPHTERLIQAFALLASRIHLKINDELPEITNALLGVLYPHYLAPTPSMSIAQFEVDPERGKLTSGHTIERETELLSAPVRGNPCRFRTGYPVTLWPIEVVSASYDTPDRLPFAPKAAAAIRLELRCLGGTELLELKVERLRFYLDGESGLVAALYELILNNACGVQLRPLGDQRRVRPLNLSRRFLQPVGFSPDEGLLPYGPRSFLGYRLLHEYFAFPEKFRFFDLCELDRATRAGLREGVEVHIFLDRLPRNEQPLDVSSFRLGCTPIVNLFKQIAEPLRVTQAQAEYRIIPDLHAQEATEIYSIESIMCSSPQRDKESIVQPFYSFRHAVDEADQRAFWYATRRPSEKQGDTGTEMFLSLVDLDFRPATPALDTLTIKTICTNRDLPGKLPFGDESGDFELDEAAPLLKIKCLTKPTEVSRTPLGRSAQWRLISHLGLNYLSLSDAGPEPLREILKLYDFGASSVVEQQIEGIVDVSSRRVVGRPASMSWNGFCRGIELTVELDERKFVGSGVYLFASVLEKFLGLYTSLNSFTQLIATTQQRDKPLRKWPPRAGEQILL